MKVLLFALTASSVAAFAPNTFGARRTFKNVDAFVMRVEAPWLRRILEDYWRI